MILLTGASGLVGRQTMAALLKAGHTVKALTSSQDSAKQLLSAGAQHTSVGNLRNEQDLRKAVKDVDTIIHIPPNIVEDEAEMGCRLVDVAEAAGIAHFVFMSCYHSHPADIPSHHNKLLVEDALYRSNLNFTVLQPCMFMQNLELIWPQVESSGVLAWPWSHQQKLAMIDIEDVAQALSNVVGNLRFYGGTFELCSGDSLTVTEMAAILAIELQRPIRADQLDAKEWVAHMSAQGFSPWTLANIMKMVSFFNDYGYRGGNSLSLRNILNREPNHYSEYAKNFAQRLTK
tara:strand:+ start:12515 stop:13381 length:867 start_codon:yes stop_codon:yes gene_type:complete